MMGEQDFSPVLGAMGRFRVVGALPRGRSWTMAAMWRGAVATRFPDDPNFHGHDGERTLYRYPLVQYRWDAEGPCLLALGAAAPAAMIHPWPGAVLQIGRDRCEIADVTWRSERFTVRPSERLVRYVFRSPWLALNQQNHANYTEATAAARRELLDRTVANNVLSMCRDLGWELPPTPRVMASFEPEQTVECMHKDVKHLGFVGSFACNWELPAGLSLGRATSHGFGWFERA